MQSNKNRAMSTSERISRATCVPFARIHTNSVFQLGCVNLALNSEPWLRSLSFLQMFDVRGSRILLSLLCVHLHCYQRKSELQSLAHAD